MFKPRAISGEELYIEYNSDLLIWEALGSDSGAVLFSSLSEEAVENYCEERNWKVI